MKLTPSLSIAFISALATSTNVYAAQQSNQRWFEIEVILFSQLGDKSLLKEDFTTEFGEVKLNRPRDLLSPYLNPVLSSLKTLVPTCGETYPRPYLEQSAELSSPVTVSPLWYIDERELTQEEVFDFQQRDQVVVSQNNEFGFTSSTSNESYQSVESVDDLFNDTTQENFEQLNTLTDEVFVSSLTPEQQLALQEQVAQAQAAFSDIQFNYQLTLPKSVCNLSDEVINQLSAEIKDFDPDGFNVANMPSKIWRYEDKFSKQPYLLNDSSLELHDIVLQLKRSRNFRPLLHVGWRQPAISKRRSRPMRLFAGENFAYAYQQSMEQYEEQIRLNEEADALAQITADAKQNQLSGNQLIDADNETYFEDNTQVSDETALSQVTIPEPLHLVDTPNPLYTIIDQLEKGDIDQSEALASLHQTTTIDELALIKPVQPEVDWTIDGLFNVHLNHYLYITAEFDVANKTLAQHQTALLTNPDDQVKAIRFSQNRRVISKEVHYFDHPYMGMIVKIRRYKVPTKPES